MSDSLRRLAAQVVGLKRDVLQLQTAPRAGQTSIEHGGAITVVDPETGAATARLGTQTDGTYGAVTLDGPTPPIPSVPILDVAPGLVAVTWDGTHADGAATPLDFYTVEVYVAAEPFAFIEEGTLSGSLVGSDGDRITIALAPGVWHVGLVTVSQAMKRSRLSSLAVATVPALPSEEDVALAGGRVTISDNEPEVADAEGKPDSALWQQVVDDALVGAWRLDAAVPEWRPIEVAPGTPYMPKIDLGSATVGLLTGARLAADAIDGKTITGATVQSSALANRGVKMDSDGLRAFSNTGVRTVNIDSATGQVDIRGRLRLDTPTGENLRVTLLNDQAGIWLLPPTGSAPVGFLKFSKADPTTFRADLQSAETYLTGAVGGQGSGSVHLTKDMAAVRSGDSLTNRNANIEVTKLGTIRLSANSINGGAGGYATILLLDSYLYLSANLIANSTEPFFRNASSSRIDLRSGIAERWNTSIGAWATDVATETKVGPVELATSAEVLAGTDAARAVTPAALASWRDSHFYLATKTTSQPGISSTPVQIAGLAITAPRAGRARIQISCTSKSSTNDDLVAYELRLNGAKIKRGTQRANSGGSGTGHLLEMTAITTIAAGGAITVWVEKPIGSGAVEIEASPADPCTLTLEYV